MQNPHCTAPLSRNAACSGESPPPSARPSTVRISEPSASTARTRHESTVRPSTITVQAPHSPTRQHSLVPVSARSSRRMSSSVWFGATSTARRAPLTVTSMGTFAIMPAPPSPGARGPWPARAGQGPGAWRAGTRDRRAWSGRTGSRPRRSSRRPLPGPRPTMPGRPGRRSCPGGAAAVVRRSRTRPAWCPVPSTPQVTVTDARSWPRRRVRRWWALAIRSAGIGSSMAVTSSPRSRVVTPERTKRSSSGIRRVPSGPATTTTAPWTRSAGTVSAAGDALHTLPASVARLRICTEPTTAAASAKAGACRRTSGSAATSVMTVVAPITRLPPSPTRIPGASSGTRLTSTTRLGASEPSRSRITRSVPPARTRASGPRSASRATASASDAGRAYSKGCMRPTSSD